MIDAHMHIGDFTYQGRVYGTFDEYLKLIRGTGIKKFCAVPIGLKDNFDKKTTPDNDLVLRLSKNDRRIIPIYWLNLFGFNREQVPYILSNYHALKFHPDIGNVSIDDSRLIQILEQINLPTFVHTNERDESTSLAKLITLANRFSDRPFVAVHSGSVTRTFFKLFNYEIPDNFYFEISGLQYELILKKIYEMVGPQRIIFGSDYPFGDPRVALERVKVVAKNKREFKQITENNISSVLSI